MVTAKKLKLIAQYAMSRNPQAWVTHQIDPSRARVVYSTRYKTGYRVEYKIQMYCGKSFKCPKIFKKLPPSPFLCKACQHAQTDPLYWEKIMSINEAMRRSGH
jgi:hypothetical protein